MDVTVREEDRGQERNTAGQSAGKAYERPILRAFGDLKMVTGSEPS